MKNTLKLLGYVHVHTITHAFMTMSCHNIPPPKTPIFFFFFKLHARLCIEAITTRPNICLRELFNYGRGIYD